VEVLEIFLVYCHPRWCLRKDLIRYIYITIKINLFCVRNQSIHFREATSNFFSHSVKCVARTSYVYAIWVENIQSACCLTHIRRGIGYEYKHFFFTYAKLSYNKSIYSCLKNKKIILRLSITKRAIVE